MQSHAEINNTEAISPEQYDSSFYFDLIIKLAQQRDLKKLRELIASDVTCIDIRLGEKTPIQQLACDGQIGSVDFLLNYFDVSLQEAITGFAIAGNIQRVNALLDQGAFSLDAIRGYARGGHHTACDELCLETINTLKQSTEVECYLAALEGYSLAKDTQYIKKYFYKIRPITHPWIKGTFLFLSCASKTAIQGHRFPFNSDSTSDQAYNTLFTPSYLSSDYVAQMLGFYGADSLIETEPYLFPHQKYIISGNAIRQPNKIYQGQFEPAYAAKALAFAGYYAKEKSLEPDFYDPFKIIFALAAGGHSQQVYKMLRSICEFNPRALSLCIENAVNGFGRFGHVKLAEKLVMQHEINIYDLFRALYVGGYLSNTQIILRTRSQFTHPWLQNELINFVNHPLFSTSIRTCIDMYGRYTDSSYLPKMYLFQNEPAINKLLWQEFIAKQININLQLTNDMQLTPTQIKAWRRPEVRSWFLNSTAFVKSLHIPRDVFNVLTHHLFSLELEDIVGIYNKLCMPIFKHLLEANLKIFINKHRSTSATISAFMFIGDLITNPEDLTLISLENIYAYNTIKYQCGQGSLSTANSLLQDLKQTSTTDNNLATTQYANIVRKQHESLSRTRFSLFTTPADQEFKGLVSRAFNRL